MGSRGASPAPFPAADRETAGTVLGPPYGSPIAVRAQNFVMNTALRVALLVWVLGFLLVSCGPLLNGHLLVGGVTFLAGVVLFIPWLIGVVVLGFLIWVTSPPRR